MWSDLSMAERAKYIQLGIQNGVTDLSTIRNVYNTYARGGQINKFEDGGKTDSYSPETLAGWVTSLFTDDARKVISADIASSSLNLGADAIPVIGNVVGAIVSAGDAIYNTGKLIADPSLGQLAETGLSYAGILPGVGNFNDTRKVAKGATRLVQNTGRAGVRTAIKKTVTRRANGKPKARVNSLDSRGNVTSSYREPLFDYGIPYTRTLGTFGNWGYSAEDMYNATDGYLTINRKSVKGTKKK